MKEIAKQAKKTIYDKDIYFVKSLHDKWAVVIMPDNIVIDNHHEKGVHIHPNPKKHKEEILINIEDKYEVHEKVINHIGENKGLKLEKLIMELKK